MCATSRSIQEIRFITLLAVVLQELDKAACDTLCIQTHSEHTKDVYLYCLTSATFCNILVHLPDRELVSL